ncbi:hypothetical protein E4T38_06854 [Aureobasidium subglaciale]|nr:hypothetical protein E4T38_06854 [Aureobasidium subglaciale]KAI5222375.1 hypothetical protein E4T41_06705 [Aureobasidium subglaciale]
MRFTDWDVILFPQTSSVPIQEFRTEFFDVVTPIGICPTVNTYITSLRAGEPFQISLHAIDTINPDGNFPHKIIDLPTRRLFFPPFHQAVGNQLQLHIPDNLGRITVGISEGYFYEAPSGTRFNPIKDVVSFKWVHAPEQILRAAGVLWPHPTIGHIQVPHMSFPVTASSQVPIETSQFNFGDFGC